MMKRNSERAEFWRMVLDEQAKSGLSIRAYCRQEGISEPSFYHWRRTIEERSAIVERGAVEPTDRLLQVHVVDSTETDWQQV
jgi:transposase-like protein